MNRVTEITKKALIAHLNELRNRAAIVDTVYDNRNGKTKLVLILEDGSQETFKGLRAA